MAPFVASRSRHRDQRIHVGLAVQSLKDPRTANALVAQLLTLGQTRSSRAGEGTGIRVMINQLTHVTIPIAFGAMFALSGAVGPIMAQNWGAGRFDRMRATLRDSFIFAGLYVLASWAVLVLCRHWIVQIFALTGPAAEGVIFFCWISGPMWFFIGLLFTANAAFNNLGFPLYSTILNWGRATIGTIPFAWGGARLFGYEGALAGMALGSVIFGIVAAFLAIRTIATLEKRQHETPALQPRPA
jgi:Na+-driven multidrug efflux pump